MWWSICSKTYCVGLAQPPRGFPSGPGATGSVLHLQAELGMSSPLYMFRVKQQEEQSGSSNTLHRCIQFFKKTLNICFIYIPFIVDC